MSTPTITLSQLHSDLLRIYAHGLSATNVTSIQHTAGGAVYFVTDTSELEADLAEAKESEARLEAELKEAEAAQARLDIENSKLVDMHAEFKDPESGITPWAYRHQAEEAERRRKLYEQAMNEAREECEALRKRKGVTVALFKHEREILALLGAISRGSMEFTQAKAEANKLIGQLHAP